MLFCRRCGAGPADGSGFAVPCGHARDREQTCALRRTAGRCRLWRAMQHVRAAFEHLPRIRGVLGERRAQCALRRGAGGTRPEEHTSELQSLMSISYAVFCLKKKNNQTNKHTYSKKTKE